MAPKLTPKTIATWDLYATGALGALSSGSGGAALIPSSVAQLAAKLADAMLAERARREEGYKAPAPAPPAVAGTAPVQGFVGEEGTEVEPGTTPD